MLAKVQENLKWAREFLRDRPPSTGAAAAHIDKAERAVGDVLYRLSALKRLYAAGMQQVLAYVIF